jgi:hypothetical protein
MRKGDKMKPLKTLVVLALAAALALVLAACGGDAGGSASSSASGESSSAGSSSGAPVDATGQAPTGSYMLAKLDVTYNNGSKTTSSFTYDDRGRQLTGSWDMASSDSAYDIDSTITDWDEYGHLAKAVETDDYGDGKPFTTTTEVSAQELNADGSLASVTRVSTIDKESFEEGEIASTKATSTLEYGGDVQVLRKFETKAEYFDKSGALLMTETQTNEFGEDGLQTGFTRKAVGADGAEINETGDITWTRDADGKPVSYEIVLSRDGADASTSTGDVKTDESGLISWVGNVKVDGEAYSTTATIDYVKIDDPLPNAYEGWKSFTLTDVIISRTYDATAQGE